MNEVVVLLGAEIELQIAYERQSTATRANALDCLVREALDQLSRYPYSGTPFLGDFRRLVLAPLHFGFFYQVEGQRIVIHAFLDLRQSPEAVRRRPSP